MRAPVLEEFLRGFSVPQHEKHRERMDDMSCPECGYKPIETDGSCPECEGGG